MDRSSSINSNSSSKSASSAASNTTGGSFSGNGLDRSSSISSNATGAFAYQTRLLERTSSRSGNSPLARTGSQSLSRAGSISTGNSSGSAAALVAARRWTPSHRVGNSMDAARGKWEDRVKTLEGSSSSPLGDMGPPPPPGPTNNSNINSASSDYQHPQYSTRPRDPSPQRRTPIALKRHTLPAHISTTPLSPNTTGVSVEGDEYDPFASSAAGGTSHRIRLPHVAPPSLASLPITKTLEATRSYSPQETTRSYSPTPSRPLRSAGSFDQPPSNWTNPLKSSEPANATTAAPIPLSRRPTSLYTAPRPPSPEKPKPVRPASISIADRASAYAAQAYTSPVLPSTPPSPEKSNRPPSALSSIADRASAYLEQAYTSPVLPTEPSSPQKSIRPSSSASSVADRASTYSSQSYTSPLLPSAPPSPEKSIWPSSSSNITDRASAYSIPNIPDPDPDPAPISSSVMSPTPYRSSYMASKSKKGTYGDLSTGAGRRLGKHLPRIASGDAEDDLVEERKETDRRRRRETRERERERRARVWDDGVPSTAPTPTPTSPRKQDFTGTAGVGVGEGEDVAGIPGRLRLSRDQPLTTPASPSPLPSLRGLWADVQRHYIQAYEYLCHVGEAQQWVEGCLGEELGFGVVEMEEGLRNGVVLAKLVRAFRGERVVRRIYEAPKLDFRHSDNINVFFNFVREVGLPEGFIFELTDLYNKKNLPKVIYCIHALSHLLARRGLAERIGNLVGQLKFSDDQLQATQKGLKDAGVAMPNFGNVGKELAKEINEEPEVEIETEEDIRTRLLLENESSIIATQQLCRGFLVRKAHATQRVRLRLAERYVPKLQGHCRGFLTRQRVQADRKQQMDLTPWAIALQTSIRAATARHQWQLRLRRIKATVKYVVKVQAQGRGVIQRRRFAQLRTAMKKSTVSVVKLQSLARARVARNAHKEMAKMFGRREVFHAVVALQAHARGVLARRRAALRVAALQRFVRGFVRLEAQARGVLVRRQMRKQMAKLEDVSSTVIRIQAAARTYLARKRLLLLIRSLRKATPMLIGLQSRARANLARQQHKNVNKALSEVKVVAAVGTFQARARAALTRNRHREQSKRLEFAAPDVVGVQATARGYLIRRDYYAWRDHLWRSEPIATILQAMLRGVLQRRVFHAKMEYYHTNLHKVVKIQSLFRAKETREQYRQLTLGSNVSVGTIKNFVHLLDDSETDFQEEIKVERLRKRVVEGIRENQALESDVSDLDVKIALVVQNVKSFEELIKARRRYGTDNAAAHATRASILAAHGDPFAATSSLDHAAKRKLELYKQLFYLLQTEPQYLSRLFLRMSIEDTPEKNRRLTERVVLTLFGYGQDRREEFLLLKLFQLAIQEEIESSRSISTIVHGHPMYINVAVHYVRPKQVAYVRETLQTIIRDVVHSEDLDLEVDPSLIHRIMVNKEEMRSGVASTKPKDLPFYQALNDPDTRAEYIRHLQILQWWTEAFVTAITQSTKKMPYGMRFLARETLVALRIRFPDASEEEYAACIGRLVYYRYINPAIITPETFDIVTNTVNVASRKNLAQISRILTQITSGVEFGDDKPSYVPINDYVRKAIAQMTTWLLEVADVPDAEAQFQAHEFLDVTVQPKPIYISPNEVYSMHTLLSQHQDQLVIPEHVKNKGTTRGHSHASARDDVLKIILIELDGVPHLGNDELKDARDRAITLELSNRFANVRDPQAEEKALWVQAKRGVLAILRVQPAQDLVESLMRPVTDEEEEIWERVLEAEMEHEQTRQVPRRQRSEAAGDSAYRLEDIRSLTFKEVKAHAIFFLLELEKLGKITRSDGFQGILNAIASDVRSKHRKRLQRQQEMASMNDAMKHLHDRKKYFEEQIDSYHNYVEAAMATMQRGKGKNRLTLPFTKQFFHLRDLQRSGQTPQFGSFKYSAKSLYEKGILLSIDQFSPRQFDKIDVIISSNKAGIFAIEVYNNTLGITNRIGSANLRMEDLLQAQFENQASLAIFNGMVMVNLQLFLYQINKKFFV